jgi:ABC-type amino acid transport substrate-binding protein
MELITRIVGPDTVSRRAVAGLAAGLMLAGSAAFAQVAPPAPGESPLADSIREAGELRAGTAIGAPGLLLDPGSGELIGPAVIVGEAIAEALGVEFTLVESNWDTIIAGLQANRYDIALAPMLVTPARLEVMDFASYYNDGICYSVLRDNPKTADITTPEELNREDINWTTVTGSSPEQFLPTKFDLPNFRSIQIPPGGSTATDEVLAGRADVVTQNATQARIIEARFPEIRIIPPAEECVLNPDFEVPVGMGILRGDPAMIDFMNAVVESRAAEIEEALLLYTSPEFAIRN